MDEQNIDFKFAALWKRAVAFIVDAAIVINLFCLLIHTVNILLALPKVLVTYFTLLESSRLQAAFGKLILGIKIVDLSGKRISFARATGRFFAKVLSRQVLLIGYFMAALSERKQTLHDFLAGTLVVTKEGMVSAKTSPTNQ